MNTLKYISRDNYLIVQLDRGAANPMNQEMLSEILQMLKDTAADDAIRGVILTGKPNFFSAGLDVIELYGYDKPTIRKFWSDFMTMVTEMSAYPKPLIAAITGHSPAGGCIMACCADYRVMANNPKYKIGLNEVAVGIVPRQNILKLYEFWLGTRKAYQYLLEGKLMSPQEAEAVGLIDELVEGEAVLAAAEAKMKKYLRLGQETLCMTKHNLKKELVEQLAANFEQNVETTNVRWWSEEGRALMGHIVAALQKK
ncbi:MAG: enoyl-CoA hydratase/isomerase family protein [Aureispira sp.]|nr:enoyl-CoA hydratase/isomerase family protein [Aureispira sp.]